MSKDLTRTNLARRRTGPETNTITFPRALRDAIPDLCGGRVLQLDSISAKSDDTSPIGRRVRLALVARETGKLKGEFTVLIDLGPSAARTLAETLAKLSEPR